MPFAAAAAGCAAQSLSTASHYHWWIGLDVPFVDSDLLLLQIGPLRVYSRQASSAPSGASCCPGPDSVAPSRSVVSS